MLDVAQHWYRRSWSWLAWLLLPFSFLFKLIVSARHFFYRCGVFKTQRFSVPVIVVGNISVGGTGKTPFVIWLAQLLRAQGYHPGIVSRGAGGKRHVVPHRVTSQDSPQQIGDEAVLLASNTQCPIVVCVDRVAAVRELLREAQCNIVISDDGLQHYRLERDIEVVIVDGARQFGNQLLLPAGPLREPVSRLQRVDFVVTNGSDMILEPIELVSVCDPNKTLTSSAIEFSKVHAVAAIGHPERFFHSLRQMDLDVITHSFPDHHLYQASELVFGDNLPIIMTEKDAVKCVGFADERYWYLRVVANIRHDLAQKILAKLPKGDHNDSEADFSQRTCAVFAERERERHCS